VHGWFASEKGIFRLSPPSGRLKPAPTGNPHPACRTAHHSPPATTRRVCVSLPLFTVGVIAISIFDTALYLRTRASLLLAILVHWLANVCGLLALHAQALNIFLAMEGIVAAAVVMAGGLRSREPLSATTPNAALA